MKSSDVLRVGVDRLGSATGLLRLLRRRARSGLTVLMYHRVQPDANVQAVPLSELVVPLSTFIEHIRLLSTIADVRTLQGSLTAQRCATPPARPSIAITFDDGYADNAEHAAPVLERFGVRGTFFITTGFVRGSVKMWYDVAAAAWLQSAARCRELLRAQSGAQLESEDVRRWTTTLKQIGASARDQIVARLATEFDASPTDRAMTPAQVTELAARGHEIGSHTVSHPMLTEVATERLAAELSESKAWLDTLAGRPVMGIAYPNGAWDARVTNAAAAAGYLYGVTTVNGINTGSTPRFELCRRNVNLASVSNLSGGHSRSCFESLVWGLHQLAHQVTGRR